MKFVQKSLGKAAEISSGQSDAVWDYVRIGLILLTGFIALNLLVWMVLEVGIRTISLEEESEWFSFMRELADSSQEEAPVPPLYWNVLTKLCQHPEIPSLPYRLMVIEETQPNAFALPGGVITITTGLIEAVGNDEITIAFLLGHELGHYKNRDHLRGLGRAILLGTCLQGLSSYGNSGIPAQLIHQAVLNTYSRKQEESADQFGLTIVYDCYGQADGALKLIQMLHDGVDLPEWAYMFLTHPAPGKRIQLMKDILSKLEQQRGQK